MAALRSVCSCSGLIHVHPVFEMTPCEEVQWTSVRRIWFPWDIRLSTNKPISKIVLQPLRMYLALCVGSLCLLGTIAIPRGFVAVVRIHPIVVQGPSCSHLSSSSKNSGPIVPLRLIACQAVSFLECRGLVSTSFSGGSFPSPMDSIMIVHANTRPEVSLVTEPEFLNYIRVLPEARQGVP